MQEGLILVKPEAYHRRDLIAKDINSSEYGLTIEKRIEQRWTTEKIRQTYPHEKYKKKWPMAILIKDIYFNEFGKDPWVEAMLISSEKDTIAKIKKLVGSLDASHEQRPEDANTLRYRHGRRGKIEWPVDGKICTFYFNGVHSSSENEFPLEKKLYIEDVIL